ncbi:hypothetical protein [Rhodococcus ruber]|uniref:hypothetical protein n=1 Tax=Rhodococcus ruber TaxID=1830 RepID=UPI001E452CA7|nr:hypothetical protein [Rhodococcus ruber]MCD2127019.1 hypothetical protein [Rhodococcus ruber]MCZ4506336.1 hypothetical protein [Rhodococcus ruber]
MEDWRLRVRIHHNDGTYLGETHTKHRDVSLVRGIAESYLNFYFNDTHERAVTVFGARITAPKRKASQRSARVVDPRVEANRRRGCPTPEKAAFRCRVDAERALVHAWAHRERGGYVPVRVYSDCPCKMWHLTSRSEWSNAA